MMDRIAPFVWILSVCAGLILAGPARGQEATFSFSYGPVPTGWSEATTVADYVEVDGKGPGWLWNFSRTYDFELDPATGIAATPHMDVFVLEGSRQAIETMMMESYRGNSLRYSGWDVARLQDVYAEGFPDYVIRQGAASESRTELDGRPAVLHTHEHAILDPSTGLTSRRRTLVYWLDAGAEGAAVIADLSTNDLHSVSLDRMEPSAIELIQTFRFGPPGSGTSPSPGSDTDGVPWEVILGAGALAGALAAAARRLARRRRMAPSAPEDSEARRREEDPDEPVGYVLQLSHDRLTLQPEQPAALTATAWRVDAAGGYERAPDAEMRIDVPSSLAGVVRVAPTRGSGQLTCRVMLEQPVAVEPTPLTITAVAPKGRTTAEVRVDAEAVYTLEFF